ncbi:forespore capture DNA-binding protein RefZ [Lederbergia citrea]|uniref:Forespore capture DNA-binding protein RefZ n=1 Tax=Lederbergia citrea TaxID=2833581 RepID=A0A942UPN7_9BACI|nr:forespore capture DNA-binding protein RefZ [Lederbergia citrea]MBS4176012.1 forespore capture DNA-binding protein RefZ [Lederbergia citrea]MBS4202573.1 forespore capture DNA-binding protein RefZ [Lederbergia citrea]MBS4222761.1 forespore capture DNA-binding protein RefZ [Lederbergia citrea]
MTLHGETTKESIIAAAVDLFNSKGFQGTTIREIAGNAKVNPANISYYFQGKRGLLEACFVRFFEPYLQCLEEEAAKLEHDHALLCLTRAIKRVLHFQSSNDSLARLVWREVSIDTQISREIMSSYLMKERYYFKVMIHSVLKESRTAFPVSMAVIQLKGMLMMPYLNSQYVREVWGLTPKEPYFVEKYNGTIRSWLESSLGTQVSAFKSDQIAFSI